MVCIHTVLIIRIHYFSSRVLFIFVLLVCIHITVLIIRIHYISSSVLFIFILLICSTWRLSRDYCSNVNMMIITRLLFKFEHDDYHATIVQIWTSHDHCSPLWTRLLFTTVNTTIVTASWTTEYSNHSQQYTHVLHYITCIRRFNTNFHDSSTPLILLR